MKRKMVWIGVPWLLTLYLTTACRISGSVYAAGSIPFIQENLNGTAAVYPGFCVSGVWFCSALSRRCDETGSGARWHLWDIFRKSDFVYSV